MFKYFLRLVVYKFVYRISNDYISFMSFNGKYADSPKFLTDSIHKKFPNSQIIWHVFNVENSDIPDYVKVVKYGTMESWKLYSKSKIIIDNVYSMHEYYQSSNTFLGRVKFKVISFLKNKKGQKFYSTWHGTPLKRIGSDSNNSSIIDFSCPNFTMIIDNTYLVKIMKKITLNKIKLVVLGEPKIDYLTDKSVDVNALKEKLLLPKNKKIVLFAPTFRSNGTDVKIEASGVDQMNMIDINELTKCLSGRFGGDWVLICRFHYHVERKVNWKNLYDKYGDKIINGNKHQDIVEYLKCADVLITDMSSCLYDFSLIKKPVFMFFPDVEYYKNIERGLYFEIDDLPFSCAKDFKELKNNIKSFDEKEYNKKVSIFMKSLGYVIIDNSSEKIADYIYKDVHNESNN